MDAPTPPMLEDILTGACVLLLLVTAVLFAWVWVPCWIVGWTWNHFHKECCDGQ